MEILYPYAMKVKKRVETAQLGIIFFLIVWRVSERRSVGPEKRIYKQEIDEYICIYQTLGVKPTLAVKMTP